MALAKPDEHKCSVGIVSVAVLSAAPQAPSVFFGAVHAAAEPPLEPEHAHVHGPPPLTRLGTPFMQRSATGA